jgi:hypothetical protein
MSFRSNILPPSFEWKCNKPEETSKKQAANRVASEENETYREKAKTKKEK